MSLSATPNTAMPQLPPPATHVIEPEIAANRYDHVEMVALARFYDRWARLSERLSPESRTELLLWSADLERTATWVGPDWSASNPPYPITVGRFLAKMEIAARQNEDEKPLGWAILAILAEAKRLDVWRIAHQLWVGPEGLSFADWHDGTDDADNSHWQSRLSRSAPNGSRA